MNTPEVEAAADLPARIDSARFPETGLGVGVVRAVSVKSYRSPFLKASSASAADSLDH